MTTEDISPRTVDLDLWTNLEALTALHEGQLAAAAAVGPALPAIAAAVEAAAVRLSGGGGRLIYVGAGTSARLAVQDGAELVPTFNWPRERLGFVIAGGEAALLASIENAEDAGEAGEARMAELGPSATDVVLGVAASGGTPFTVSAVKTARRLGALTVGIANNPDTELLKASEHPILVDTGAEPIAGSTRLKAGTAQKVALNLFSTLTMVRLGRVYRGLMVEMRPSNEKLRRRARLMVVAISGCGGGVAAAALEAAEGDVKLAVLIAGGVGLEAARALLDKHRRNLRSALAEAR